MSQRGKGGARSDHSDPLGPVCVCVCAGCNSLTELIVVFLHSALSGDLTHYKSFKLLICMHVVVGTGNEYLIILFVPSLVCSLSLSSFN